jgi:Lipase (class 3)
MKSALGYGSLNRAPSSAMCRYRASTKRRLLVASVILGLSTFRKTVFGENAITSPLNQHKPYASSSTASFPTLDDTLEMAMLSSLVYAFHKEDYGNDDIDNHVCDRINNVTSSHEDFDGRPVPANITCEWYHHDWTGGTQVMIVSSVVKNYVAVIFAGTDDLSTSLTDADILTTSFGTYTQIAAETKTSGSSQYSSERAASVSSAERRRRRATTSSTWTAYPVYNVSLVNAPLARVHAGFNHAIFDRNLFGEIVFRVEQLRCRISEHNRAQSATGAATTPTNARLFTSGHSLGAANAALTAVGLVQYYEQRRRKFDPIAPAATCCETRLSTSTTFKASSRTQSSKQCAGPPPVDHIVSINFGCPQTGNAAWRDFIHSDPTMLRRLSIWRLVLGWDLVPRLPQFFHHVGHTVQLANFHALFFNQSVVAYYQHLGNVTLQLAGVPFGWSATPFLWVPGALYSHFMKRYCTFLGEWYNQTTNSSINPRPDDSAWIHSFVRVPDAPPDDDHDNRPPNVDDDFYVDPPNDRGK